MTYPTTITLSASAGNGPRSHEASHRTTVSCLALLKFAHRRKSSKNESASFWVVFAGNRIGPGLRSSSNEWRRAQRHGYDKEDDAEGDAEGERFKIVASANGLRGRDDRAGWRFNAWPEDLESRARQPHWRSILRRCAPPS